MGCTYIVRCWGMQWTGRPCGELVEIALDRPARCPRCGTCYPSWISFASHWSDPTSPYTSCPEPPAQGNSLPPETS